MLCTDLRDVALAAQDLKSMAFGTERNYFHARIGYNFRMPNSQATLAIGSLAMAPHNIALRNAQAELYDRALKPLFKAGNILPMPKRQSAWVYDFMVKKAADREALYRYLEKHKACPRRFFSPLQSMPMYRPPTGIPRGTNAWVLSEAGMYFPLGEKITNEIIKQNVDLIKSFYETSQGTGSKKQAPRDRVGGSRKRTKKGARGKVRGGARA
jgi:dTDP-4-amino-4,6-dideoxygalactose transaminase